jgi:hypothetical protein
VVPPIEHLEQARYHVKVPTYGLGQQFIIPRGVLVQQTTTTSLHINLLVATRLPMYGNRIPF